MSTSLHRSAWNQEVADAVEAPLFIVDHEYRIVLSNRAHGDLMRAMTGTDIGPGASMLENWPSETDRAHLQSFFERALNGETVWVAAPEAGDHHRQGIRAAFFAPLFEGDSVVAALASVIDDDARRVPGGGTVSPE